MMRGNWSPFSLLNRLANVLLSADKSASRSACVHGCCGTSLLYEPTPSPMSRVIPPRMPAPRATAPKLAWTSALRSPAATLRFYSCADERTFQNCRYIRVAGLSSAVRPRSLSPTVGLRSAA
jgi:hypothetical protein